MKTQFPPRRRGEEHERGFGLSSRGGHLGCPVSADWFLAPEYPVIWLLNTAHSHNSPTGSGESSDSDDLLSGKIKSPLTILTSRHLSAATSRDQLSGLVTAEVGSHFLPQMGTALSLK